MLKSTHDGLRADFLSKLYGITTAVTPDSCGVLFSLRNFGAVGDELVFLQQDPNTHITRPIAYWKLGGEISILALQRLEEKLSAAGARAQREIIACHVQLDEVVADSRLTNTGALLFAALLPEADWSELDPLDFQLEHLN